MSAALAWASTRDARGRSSNAHGTLTGNLWWKLPALGMLYIVLFLTAGSLILPYIREFYGRNNLIVMPSFGVLLLTEFIRGLVHVSLAVAIPAHDERPSRCRRRCWPASRSQSSAASPRCSCPLTTSCRWQIRRVHIAEIFGSNFLFGVITAGLLVRRVEAAAPRFAVLDGHAPRL